MQRVLQDLHADDELQEIGSDTIDRILTHRVAGLAVFVAILTTATDTAQKDVRAARLQALHQGVSYQSDEFNRTMSAAERANPIQVNTCRDGHTGRLCQVCPCSAFTPVSWSPSSRVRWHTPSLAHNPPHTDAQACKDGYTVQGIYCGMCSGTDDPTVRLLAAPLGTSLIPFILGSWCLRPYFAKLGGVTDVPAGYVCCGEGQRLCERARGDGARAPQPEALLAHFADIASRPATLATSQPLQMGARTR